MIHLQYLTKIVEKLTELNAAIDNQVRPYKYL